MDSDKQIESEDISTDKDPKHMEYTTFHETYQIITFAMCISMIYPNPNTDMWRIKWNCILLLSVTPMAAMMLMDMYNSWLQRDIINIIRHCTVTGPFLGGYLKFFLMFYKRETAKQIMDEIDHDYATFNSLPTSYKSIIDASIRNNVVYSERCWVITVLSCTCTFPIMAGVLTVYNALFVDEPERFMVHDLNIPYTDPEVRFQSPYFEIMFAYMLYCVWAYSVNFTGYDGFFGLTINHACLKMQLYCKAFEEAMGARTKREMGQKLMAVIEAQNRVFQYIELIQETFNIWLGVILAATMIQICNCMYHITEGYGLDLRYMVFIIGSVVHIYLPCRYCSKLKHESLETATALYCGGWERTDDVSMRKSVQFMIARGQVQTNITAFNIMVFDMELFVSILQTSYSMYTLLRS